MRWCEIMLVGGRVADEHGPSRRELVQRSRPVQNVRHVRFQYIPTGGFTSRSAPYDPGIAEGHAEY